MGERVQQRTCAPHLYRPVRPVVGTPSEKAALGLGPTLGWRSPTRTAGPLLLPRRLLHRWVTPETAEGQQNRHVRKGCWGEKNIQEILISGKGALVLHGARCVTTYTHVRLFPLFSKSGVILRISRAHIAMQAVIFL